MTRVAASVPLLLIAATCGCTSLSGGLNPFAKKYVAADAENPAIEVACIWQPGEGRNENGIPTRGFSGQVFFFTQSDSEPAIVDGNMRVYLFADRGTPEERAKPIRQFDFAPEAWALHATRTSLGPGYSVFIPYPLQEPYQVRCQLRARFTPRQGPVIWSEAVAMTLEGPLRPEEERMSLAASDADAIPTVSDFQVNRQLHAATELGDETIDEATQNAPRRLRVETFPLDGVQPASYEAPVRETAPSPARSRKPPMLTADDLEERLAQLQSRSGARAPETDRRRPASRAPHPLDQTPAQLPRRPAASTAAEATEEVLAEAPLAGESDAAVERPQSNFRLGGRASSTGPRHPLIAPTASRPRFGAVPRINVAPPAYPYPSRHPLAD